MNSLSTNDTCCTRYSFEPSAMRQARIQAGCTIEDAASLAHLNKMTLLRYESGDIHQISEDRLLRLSQVYHIPAAALLGIPAGQEFFLPEDQIHFVPDAASEPSCIGKRLLCVRHVICQKDR